MKKKTLGATLQRSIDKLREFRHADAVAAAGQDRRLVQLDSNSQALVADMFASARTRIAKIISMQAGQSEVSVRIGSDGPGASQQPRSEAIRTLRDACWPMTISEGIQLSANPFRYEWDALKEWAAKEELTVEIRSEPDKAIATTAYLMAVKPR